MSEGKEKSKPHLRKKVVLKIIFQNWAIEREILFKKILEKYPNAKRMDIFHFLNRALSKGFIVVDENSSYFITEKGKSIYFPSTN